MFFKESIRTPRTANGANKHWQFYAAIYCKRKKRANRNIATCPLFNNLSASYPNILINCATINPPPVPTTYPSSAMMIPTGTNALE